MDAHVLLGMPANSVRDAITAGLGFVYSTAATGIAGAAAGVNSAPMLWNPSDSGVRLRILEVKYGGVSGTVIAAHIAYGVLLKAGAQVATAGPVVSLTEVPAVNLLPGAGMASRIRFAPATVTLIAAPTYWMPAGFSSGGAQAAGPLYSLIDKVDGKIVIPPGVAFFPYISNGAIALVASVAVLAIEEPLS
jgi:hypothetical protein